MATVARASHMAGPSMASQLINACVVWNFMWREKSFKSPLIVAHDSHMSHGRKFQKKYVSKEPLLFYGLPK